MTAEELIKELQRFDPKSRVLVISHGNPCDVTHVEKKHVRQGEKSMPVIVAHYLWLGGPPRQ